MPIKKIIAVLAFAGIVSINLSENIQPNTTNQVVQAAKKKTKKKKTSNYVTAKIKLPKGYTKEALAKAYAGKPSSTFIKASMQGMQDNNFSRIKTAENSKDAKRKIRIDKLTAAQRKELANYALRLINGARKQLKLKPWKYSKGVDKLAVDIATEYQTHGKSIKDGDHYVEGIVRACQKNGLNFDDNYVEDMAGFTSKTSTLTMNELKKDIYFGLKQMIFGYTGSSESGRNNIKNYREWEHAGDIFNIQNSSHDGDYNYFGISISKTGKVYSIHFISVPRYAINNSKYNQSFKL